ncbi:MAG TPA: hypothetical protein DGG94_07130 [Micromonosporaceae bacterium]|nr:hypothetical protein [Micromonosporaceae bacterium]HCU49559.1 hypothetical protein [Micromonosporaceae bacterium]
MALTDQDRARLLAVYRERVAGYANVDADFALRWHRWCCTLLSHGGVLVVPPRGPEPDLDLLLAAAVAFISKARFVEGDSNACHANVAAPWVDGEVELIGTGHALSDDGLWRQHSWGVDSNATVETTFGRVAYVGITLGATPSVQFAAGHDGDHLSAVVAAGGTRARELTDLIRAARTASSGSD